MLKTHARDGRILARTLRTVAAIRSAVVAAGTLISKTLLTRGDANPKTSKAAKAGFLTYVLHLAASDLSGFNVCQFASPGCRLSCLMYSGRAGIAKATETLNLITRARVRKTIEFFTYRDSFLGQLAHEIGNAIKYSRRKGLIPCFRLNGTSDLPWERIAPGFFLHFADVQFYDYTKDHRRMMRYLVDRHNRRTFAGANADAFPENYHLTFSLSETNERHARAILAMGGNVAVPFVKGTAPLRFMGARVISGMDTDLRFRDPESDRFGYVVALDANGRARKDKTGFVVNGNTDERARMPLRAA